MLFWYKYFICQRFICRKLVYGKSCKGLKLQDSVIEYMLFILDYVLDVLVQVSWMDVRKLIWSTFFRLEVLMFYIATMLMGKKMKIFKDGVIGCWKSEYGGNIV